MMENIIPTRKPIVCRYFAASGTCFYGNDCQFLHNASATQRTSMSPTFPPNAANFPSPARTSARRATESPSIMMENNGLTSDSNRLLQQSYLRSMSVVQQSSSSSGVESLVQKTQSLAMTTELVGTHSHSLFEVSFHL